MADFFLISDISAAKALSLEAIKQKRKARLILMVELGDGREGFNPDQVIPICQEIIVLENIEILGIGTNVSCLSGVAPIPERLEFLVKIKKEIEQKLSYSLKVISGGNSSAWQLIAQKTIPSKINQLRIGEAILLGQETVNYEAIREIYQDAFIITAEVIEVREKTDIDNKGKNVLRVVIALGKQDIGAGFLKPITKEIKVVKISSDHLVVEIGLKKNFKKIKCGDTIDFIPDYFALVGAMSGQFVCRKYWSSRADYQVMTN